MSSKPKPNSVKGDGDRGLVPKLRFPSFRAAPAWGLKRGDALFDVVNNRSAAPGLPVLAITQEHGAIPRDHIDYHVSATAESIATYKEVCVGDFIISLRSFQGGIEYSQFHGICSPAYVILRRRGEGSDDYFRHLFKSARFIQQLNRNIEGLRDGKMVSYAQFSEQLILVPEPTEQEKIAKCLTSLDDVIAAQGRRVEALKAHKNVLMQHLFPQKGQTLPRLRFPEFHNAEEWVDTTLAAVGTMKAGEFVSASHIADTPDSDSFPCYGGNGLRGYTKTFTHRGKYALIGRQGALCGNAFLVDGKFHATEHALVVTPASGVDVAWLHHALGFLNLNRFSIGQAQPGLSVTVLQAVPIALPKDEAEQRRIAHCLSSIDGVIAAEAAALAALKEHKSGLMQQLIPAPSPEGH
jgi:type I restriction enzyme, S subunit